MPLGLPEIGLVQSQQFVNSFVENKMAEAQAAAQAAELQNQLAQMQLGYETQLSNAVKEVKSSLFDNFLNTSQYTQPTQSQFSKTLSTFGGATGAKTRPFWSPNPSFNTWRVSQPQAQRTPVPKESFTSTLLRGLTGGRLAGVTDAALGAQPQGRLTPQMGYAGKAHKANNKWGLQPSFWAALSRASADMVKAGLGSIKVGNGFRSDELQRSIYNKPHRAGYVAKPGSSKHRTGFVADLQLTKAQQNWLRTNGWKYGIYAPMWNPTGKNRVVERWHWEYWGVANPKLVR